MISRKYFIYAFFVMITYSALLAECKLCPDLISIKVILKNGVIRTGHMSYGPEEELREKFDRYTWNSTPLYRTQARQYQMPFPG